MQQQDPSSASFWSNRYQSGSTGWDLGQPAPNLQSLTREYVSEGAHVFVPGAGRGHDAIALAQAGYRVTALDFAPEAIDAAQTRAGESGVTVEWVLGDLFAERAAWRARFDAWVELTCFCAIPLDKRQVYVDLAARYLRPGGRLLGLFFIGLPAGGPPFDSTPDEIRSLFSPSFELEVLRPSTGSVPDRQGMEWEGVFRRR